MMARVGETAGVESSNVVNLFPFERVKMHP